MESSLSPSTYKNFWVICSLTLLIMCPLFIPQIETFKKLIQLHSLFEKIIEFRVWSKVKSEFWMASEEFYKLKKYSLFFLKLTMETFVNWRVAFYRVNGSAKSVELQVSMKYGADSQVKLNSSSTWLPFQKKSGQNSHKLVLHSEESTSMFLHCVPENFMF